MKSLDELRSGTPLVSRASSEGPTFGQSNIELRAAGSPALLLSLHASAFRCKDCKGCYNNNHSALYYIIARCYFL